MSTYVPRPIDTSVVILDPDLDGLIERLAANNHDHWAKQRMSEGWRFGARRDDGKKQHPDRFRTKSFRTPRRNMIGFR